MEMYPVSPWGLSGWWFGPWNFMTFHSVGIMIPTDEIIFFRGVDLPPTSIS
jgi:hypothetical protein